MFVCTSTFWWDLLDILLPSVGFRICFHSRQVELLVVLAKTTATEVMATAVVIAGDNLVIVATDLDIRASVAIEERLG